MYSLGVYAITSLAMYGNLELDTRTIAYILLVAHACYLFDRVKFTDHRQDPADAIALPTRAIIFSQHSQLIRALIGIELIAATITGSCIHPLLASIPLMAMLVVHIYAGRGATPDSPRLKDLPILKAFIIAGGHVALVLVVLWSNQLLNIAHIQRTELMINIGVWLIVAGDAVLCDIDDLDADRAYRTQSLAVSYGSQRAWHAAIGFILIGSLLLTLATESVTLMLSVGASLIMTTMMTRHNTNHRDFVDFRLLPIVLLFTWVLN